MRRQLELWPPSKEPSQIPKIWKTLTRQQKQEVLTALAGLINKLVRTEETDQNQEESHER
jgi:hypothetical protein